MTALKKYYYIAPALLYYLGLSAYFILNFPGRWINAICTVALLLLVQIVVCILSKRRSPLIYSFSYLVPTALCVSLVGTLLQRTGLSYVWMSLAILFALAIILGSRYLRSIPRNTTAVWMGVFIMLVEFSFLAGLLSVL